MREAKTDSSGAGGAQIVGKDPSGTPRHRRGKAGCSAIAHAPGTSDCDEIIRRHNMREKRWAIEGVLEAHRMKDVERSWVEGVDGRLGHCEARRISKSCIRTRAGTGPKVYGEEAKWMVATRAGCSKKGVLESHGTSCKTKEEQRLTSEAENRARTRADDPLLQSCACNHDFRRKETARASSAEPKRRHWSRVTAEMESRRDRGREVKHPRIGLKAGGMAEAERRSGDPYVGRFRTQKGWCAKPIREEEEEEEVAEALAMKEIVFSHRGDAHHECGRKGSRRGRGRGRGR
jgi:hypothetical protein